MYLLAGVFLDLNWLPAGRAVPLLSKGPACVGRFGRTQKRIPAGIIGLNTLSFKDSKCDGTHRCEGRRKQEKNDSTHRGKRQIFQSGMDAE